MTFICLWSPGWAMSPEVNRLAPVVLGVVPRVSVDLGRGLLWADGRVLDIAKTSTEILTRIKHQGATKAQVGLSSIPIASQIVAIHGSPCSDSFSGITTVLPGSEREFIASHLISVLAPSPPLMILFDGVGIETCGDLARLAQESVEVRFGAEGVHLWRLSRADDRRLIFTPMSRSLPEASLDWVDYILTDPERLVFVINALVDNVSTALASRGLCARHCAVPAVSVHDVRSGAIGFHFFLGCLRAIDADSIIVRPCDFRIGPPCIPEGGEDGSCERRIGNSNKSSQRKRTGTR